MLSFSKHESQFALSGTRQVYSRLIYILSVRITLRGANLQHDLFLCLDSIFEMVGSLCGSSLWLRFMGVDTGWVYENATLISYQEHYCKYLSSLTRPFSSIVFIDRLLLWRSWWALKFCLITQNGTIPTRLLISHNYGWRCFPGRRNWVLSQSQLPANSVCYRRLNMFNFNQV